MDAPLAPAAPAVAAVVASDLAVKSIVSSVVEAAAPSIVKPDLAPVGKVCDSPTIAADAVKNKSVVAPGGDGEDPLLPLVRRAFPSLQVESYDVLGRVKQANAEGARLLVRFVSNDGEDSSAELFVKRVDAAHYAPTKKGWADLRRTLVYARTEFRFYAEFLPLLGGSSDAMNGLAPKCHLAECDLAGLIGDDESATDVKHGRAEGSSYEGRGGALVLESVDPAKYYQRSPLNMTEASKCLAAVAKLHASAWENETVLKLAADRLSENGGSYHLHIRNPKELENMESSWDKFRENFRHLCPVLDRPSVATLGRRMKDMAEFVCDALSPKVRDKYATVVHGDYKAMNVFLPKDGVGSGDAVMIDFASAGVGMGMSDVAMHVVHAVRPEDLADGGEEALVDGYLDALHSALVASATADSTAVVEHYPRDIAYRHYRLALVDYFRFILGRFYGSSTPEQFEKKKDLENRTLVNRNLEAAVAFVDRVDRYLSEFEEEKRRRGM